MTAQRLIGAWLPAIFPEQRETISAACSACTTVYAVDLRVPMPAACPDCSVDVVATQSDEENRAQPRRTGFNQPRLRRQ